MKYYYCFNKINNIVDSEVYVGRKFETEFVDGVLELGEGVVNDFLEVCGILASEGVAPDSSGNISIRKEEGMLITAGGVELGEVGRKDLIYVVDYDARLKKARVLGNKEPSSETPMHWMIYQNFPGVNAVVHAHDQLVLENFGVSERLGIKAIGEMPYGTPELAKQVTDALRKSNYVLMRNHGSVSVGVNLREALNLMLQIHHKLENEGID